MNEYKVIIRDKRWAEIEMTCRAKDFNDAEQEALQVYDDGICSVISIELVTRNSSIVISEDVLVEYNKRGFWDVNVWCGVEGHGNWFPYNSFLTKEEAVAWANVPENVA